MLTCTSTSYNSVSCPVPEFAIAIQEWPKDLGTLDWSEPCRHVTRILEFYKYSAVGWYSGSLVLLWFAVSSLSVSVVSLDNLKLEVSVLHGNFLVSHLVTYSGFQIQLMVTSKDLGTE